MQEGYKKHREEITKGLAKLDAISIFLDSKQRIQKFKRNHEVTPKKTVKELGMNQKQHLC